MFCECCEKKGHDISFCPIAAPGSADPTSKCPWADELINSERVSCARYEGKEPEVALKMLMELGEKFNQGNPAANDEKALPLKKNIGYWKAMGADNVCLSWIWYGLPRPFYEKPPREMWPNAESANRHHEFVDAEIGDGVAKGKFVEVPDWFPELIHPMQVEVTAEGKKRLCHNMMPSNSYLPTMPFKLERLARVGPDIVFKDGHLLTADLTKAYYTVHMAEEALPYNCFFWRGKYYTSRCLLFGDGLGPYYFTKLGRPMLAFMRMIGINCTLYIDDFLSCVLPEASAKIARFQRAFLERLGWTISEKSCFEGATTQRFTGFEVDSAKMLYRLPQDKVAAIEALLLEFWKCAPEAAAVPYKQVQRLEGTLVAAQLAVVHTAFYARLLARARRRVEVDKGVFFTQEELDDLSGLPDDLVKFNGAPIVQEEASVFASVDAGGVGLGACQINTDPDVGVVEIAEGFSENQLHTSSTARELRAALRLLQQQGQNWQGQALRLYMDSHNAVRNLLRGGSTKTAELLQLCKEIQKVCDRWKIVLLPQWVPREENKVADSLSKLYDGGKLQRRTWESIRRYFGADTQVVVPSFNDPTGEARKVAATSEGDGFAIVVPNWPSQHWWTTIKQLNARSGGSRLLLGPYHKCFVVDETKRKRPPKWEMWAYFVSRRAVRNFYNLT